MKSRVFSNACDHKELHIQARRCQSGQSKVLKVAISANFLVRDRWEREGLRSSAVVDITEFDVRRTISAAVYVVAKVVGDDERLPWEALTRERVASNPNNKSIWSNLSAHHKALSSQSCLARVLTRKDGPSIGHLHPCARAVRFEPDRGRAV